jgi:NADPH:quinone reductase-like Zn-dependent oxidoreductase
MVKVVRFHETGGPDVLRIEELPPREPGPDEVRINVEAIGLNRAEAMFRSGQYLEPVTLPARIGYEAAGRIDAVGSAVEGFRPGDAVSVIPSFSMNDYGVYGEQAVVPARAVVKTPPGTSAVEAAALWMQYLTAYGALIDIGGLASGDFVIIPAASSSVGLAAIQIARMVGATPIATTRSSAKKLALLEAGAAHVIATAEEDLEAEVKRITGGQGARIVFDPVAGPYVETLAAATARGGTIFLYGILSMQPTPFPLFKALSSGLTLRGYTLFEITSDAERLVRGVAFVERGLAEGVLKPKIAKMFRLDEIVEAHRYMESNEQIGKIVATV